MKLSEINPYIIDPDTGLPLLPENYFFRVKKSSYGSPYIHIMHRRQIKILWLFPTTITEEMRNRYIAGEVSEENIRSEASRVVRDLRRQVYSDEALYGDESLYGDYPPKSLVN